MDQDWNKLTELFASVDDDQQMEKLLKLLLTQSEQQFLIDRFNIIRALLEDKLTQREIAEEMKVSIAKITAGSNELKRTPQETKQLLIDFLSL